MSKLIAQVMRAAQHTFVGRIGADPEIKFLNGGMSVANARLAVAYKKDVDPDWFSLEAWNDAAQELADGVHKGDLVLVTGRIKFNTYTSKKTGEEMTEVIITVQSFQVLDRKQPQQAAPPADEEDDDEIPF